MTGPGDPARYLHGDGQVVVVSARVAAWLDHHAELSRLRLEHRGEDPETDAVLVALRAAAATWRTHVGCASDTEVDGDAQPVAGSAAMTVTETAARLRLTPQAIRRAISEGRLPAIRRGRQWFVEAADAGHFQARRSAAC